MSSALITPIHDANCPLNPLYRATPSPYQQAGTGHARETNCTCNARRVATYTATTPGVFYAPATAPVSVPVIVPSTHQALLSSPPPTTTAGNRISTPIPPRRHTNPAEFSHTITYTRVPARRSSDVRPDVVRSTYQEPHPAVVQSASRTVFTQATAGTQQPLTRQALHLPKSMYQSPGQNRKH